MKIPRNISSELPRIGPSENPSKYPEEDLPRYIPRSFPTNMWSSEFPRKFVSSEFRRKIPKDFRGKMNFRRVISEDLFRREMGEVVSVRFCRDMALGDRLNLSISPVSKMVRVLLIMISDLKSVIRLSFDAEAGNEFTTLLCLRFGCWKRCVGELFKRTDDVLYVDKTMRALLLDGPELNPSSKSVHGSPTSLLGVYLIELSRRSRGSNKCECGQLNRMWLTRER
ncbi:hypothetical protein DY000_02013486 [Brassica cretica]|uniref:Uncharacterized protein n=1 Tax=Brassica cretica TaxID=69181 RepID=A0ABQ7DBM5_BRACR|nr:hypothetical protein DY000_02013486 [Brassica cretica]